MAIIPFKATEIKSDAVKVTPRTRDGVREDGDLWVRSDLGQVRVRMGGKTYFLYPSDECPADVVEYADDANTVALYHFDQTAGDVIDSSSYANHGINIGATRGQAGRFDYAFQFNGIDDRVRFPNATQLNPVNEITIEAHVYATAQAEMILLEKGVSAQYRIKTLVDNRIAVLFGGLGEFISSKAIPTNKWCHIACVMGTVSGTERWVKIYIDGEEVFSNMSVWGTLNTTTNPLIIGCSGDESSLFYSGKIDEVRISNKTRDPTEFNIPRVQPVAFKDQLLVSDFGGLIVHWNAGRAVIAGSSYWIEEGELTLTDGATNYVYIDDTGAVAFNTTGFPDEAIPLAKVATSGGVIQSIEDWRSYRWLHHKKNHSHAEDDIDDVPEANVIFNVEAGHNHDGINSRAIAANAANTQTIIARAHARPQLANILVGTNDPRDLDGLIVETVAGNITRDLDKMEIIGGSATATGHSWMYWDLDTNVTKVYMRARLNEINARHTAMDICSASGATLDNPPNFYYIQIFTLTSGEDLRLGKNVGGTVVFLAAEAVDLSRNKYYDIEFYYEGDGTGNNKILIWRDGTLVIEYSETETGIPSIASVRFRVFDYSTTEATKGRYSRPFVILTEA